MQTKVKTDQEISAMRTSGQMLATVLDVLVKNLSVGMSTKDLSELAKQTLRPLGGQPTFLGYQGFPDVICISLNDEVVHGIPRTNQLIQEGDIVSLDFGVTYKGMITDSAVSVIAGKGSNKAQKLIDDTKAALLAGVYSLKDGGNVGDVSASVQRVLEAAHYGIVRDLVGHGVGHELHEEPNIPNYGHKGSGPKLIKGMTIAIEPMATLGSYEVVTDHDGWTVRTADGSLSAHFEHTVLVTDNGAEILTALPDSI